MRKITFKHWLLFGGIVALAGIFAARIMASDRCPIDLPAEYHLVQYQPKTSAAALALNDIDGVKDNGTCSSWLFLAPGTAEQAADRVFKFLSERGGNWRRLPSRSFIIFSHRGNAPEVVIMPGKFSNGEIDPSFHRLRINGEWETSGAEERVLALLPRSWLEKIAQDK